MCDFIVPLKSQKKKKTNTRLCVREYLLILAQLLLLYVTYYPIMIFKICLRQKSAEFRQLRSLIIQNRLKFALSSTEKPIKISVISTKSDLQQTNPAVDE